MSKIKKNFFNNSHYIADLKLCSVRLIDNSKFPWIILIPKRKNVNDIIELNTKDQVLLMKEIVSCSKIMKKAFKTSMVFLQTRRKFIPCNVSLFNDCLGV